MPCHCFGTKKSWLGRSQTRDRTSPRGDAWRRRRSSSGGRVPALAGPLRPLRRLRLRRSRRRRLRPHGTGPPPRPRRTRRYPRSSRLAPVRDLGAARVYCSIRSLVPSGPGDLDGFTLAWGDRALVCDANHCSSCPPLYAVRLEWIVRSAKSLDILLVPLGVRVVEMCFPLG